VRPWARVVSLWDNGRLGSGPGEVHLASALVRRHHLVLAHAVVPSRSDPAGMVSHRGGRTSASEGQASLARGRKGWQDMMIEVAGDIEVVPRCL